MEDRNIMKAIQSRLFQILSGKIMIINVLEQANIPQFSRLDDMGTPLRLFETSHEIFRLFVGMLLLSGSYKLPDGNIYQETFLDTFVKVMSDSMPGFNKVFFEISVIVATKNLIDKNNSGSFIP